MSLLSLTRFNSRTQAIYSRFNQMCQEIETNETELQEQINVLSTKTSIPIPFNDGIKSYIDSYNKITKVGNLVEITFSVQKTDGSNFTKNIDLATIPTGYYPALTKVFAARGETDRYANRVQFVAVLNTGKLVLRPTSTDCKFLSGTICYYV